MGWFQPPKMESMFASSRLAKTPILTSTEYRPAIDGLRAIAVLAVFLFHLNRRWLPGGFVGVDIFFVVSGYLITSIILRDCESNRFSFGRFYQRRIARLLPAFFTVAVATVLGAFFVYSNQDLASAGANLSASAASIANLKFMLQGNYFVLSPDAQPFLHCWSLSVEEQFYLIFPIAFLVLSQKAYSYKAHFLAAFGVVSFLACIVITYMRPEWAFYLLPTRAWELLVGAILATWKQQRLAKGVLVVSLPSLGLVLIILSFFLITQGRSFPGYLAALPVGGTAFLLNQIDTSTGFAGRLLSWRPLVLVGRMSYSLYLWHWPVFSLVDYRFYLASPHVRLILKILVSGFLTTACFVFVEQPGRVYLNHPSRRRLAFTALVCSLVTLIPLGILIRKTNYIDADMSAIVKGGIRFNQSANKGSMILMGDSNGSMYGKMAKDLAKELGLKLNVISVDAGDSLPHSSGQKSPLWEASLDVVRRDQPDFLVLVCNWSKLKGDEGRLGIALEQLKHFSSSVILITQPPELPEVASREGIRNGNRPPFIEDPKERTARQKFNNVVKSLQRKNVTVVDIESLFSGNEGVVRFTDDYGNQLYQDSNHLSAAGANLVKAYLVKAMIDQKPALK
jgi:peptidoglycan/LPS O-acetylase OafA/YrhL